MDSIGVVATLAYNIAASNGRGRDAGATSVYANFGGALRNWSSAIETSGSHPQSSAGTPERLNQVENWLMPIAIFIMLTCELTHHKRDTFLP
jgi:hypothetical protein